MTPKQVFEDSFRMAELLIHVYRLLDNDGLQTEGNMVTALRGLLECEKDEQVQLIGGQRCKFLKQRPAGAGS